MFVEELREGNCGERIGRGTAGFPGLKGAEPDREPAPAQQRWQGVSFLCHPILCEWAVGKREIVLLDRENALGSEARL